MGIFFAMTASLTITFEDGTTKELPLCGNAIEIDHNRLQEIRFGQTKKGWMFSFTKPTMEGKKIREIKFSNSTP